MHHSSVQLSQRGGALAGGGSAAPSSRRPPPRCPNNTTATNAGRANAGETPSRRRSRGRDQDDEDDYDPGGDARRRSAEAADAERARRRRDGGGGATTPGTAGGGAPLLPCTRLKLVVAYDGTSFAGFQFQKPGVRTVQGELEKGMARVFSLRGRLVGAGRTDGGAHARAMPCHVDVALEAGTAGGGGVEGELRALELAALHLNGHLPPDVKVLSLGRAPLGVPRAKGGGGLEEGGGAQGPGVLSAGDDDEDEGAQQEEEEEEAGVIAASPSKQDGEAGAGAGAAAAAADGGQDEPPLPSPLPHPPPPPPSLLFDAQACALGKEYHYLLSVSARPDPFDEGARRWWAYDRHAEATRGRPPSPAALQALDFAAMRAALAALVGGPRDFTALSDSKRPSGLGAAKRKRPKLARLAEQGLLGPRPERTAQRNTRVLWRAGALDEGGGRARLVLAGDGFLYHQARVAAAVLLEVGQGRLSVAAFEKGMRERDRSFGGGERGRPAIEAAPACGLYLARVFYPGDEEVAFAPSADV